MTDQDGYPAQDLAEGERVLWSGRSRRSGVAAAIAPNLAVAAFAGCLAFGFAPASNSMGILLSPIVESALRTVTPLPVPQIYIDRTEPKEQGRPGPTPIAYVVPVRGPARPAPAPSALQPPASDVDVGVGAFLMVCKTLLLYLAAATAFLGLRSLVRQLSSRHAVTNLRVASRRGGSLDAVALRSVQGIRMRRHPFGTSVALDVAGRRRPFLLLGLSTADAAAVVRSVASGLDTHPA